VTNDAKNLINSLDPEFIPDEEQDKNTNGQTQGETEQVDHHIGLVFQQVSPGGFQARMKAVWSTKIIE